MSKNELIKSQIVNHPKRYFDAQSKTLEERIAEVRLNDDTEKEITTDHQIKFVRDKLLGLFKVGEIISEIVNWNESVDSEIKEAKKEYLLAQYFNKNDKNELALNQLREFLTDPQGNTLFNKILRIMDDTPPDIELADHLTTALKYMIANNFADLFDQHKYALSQIELLTPQALSILSDHRSWPGFPLKGYVATGGKITSEWLPKFTKVYCAKKGIKDSGIIDRVKHSINGLISARLIEARPENDENYNVKCHITDVGKLLLPYIDA